MLSQLTLKNFKGFADCELSFSALTFLVGANASGKSNLFDAVRFLQGVGLGLSFSEIFGGRWEAGHEIWAPLRGGVAEVAHHQNSSFIVNSVWATDRSQYYHHIEVRVEPEPEVIDEGAGVYPEKRDWLINSDSLSLGGKAGTRPGGVLRVGLARSGSGKEVAVDLSSHRSTLGQIQSQKPIRPEVLECQRQLLGAFRTTLFLDLSPSLMRGYVSRQARHLGLQGQNLSGVLWELCQDPDKKERIQDWLSELCAPEITELGFVETGLGDVMLQVKEGNDTWVSARSMSDGTLRFLGLLVALQTAPDGSTLLIEEIDNGLHPSRISLLIELLTNYTKNRKVQVIATTHSPYLLGQLQPEVLKGSILLARHPEENHCVATRIGNLAHLDEVMLKRSFEHLFTTRWLERAL